MHTGKGAPSFKDIQAALAAKGKGGAKVAKEQIKDVNLKLQKAPQRVPKQETKERAQDW